MWCPRCKSSRIQRGYEESLIILRMAGLHKLLCNNCSLEFRGFDPLRKLPRTPAKRTKFAANERRFPRHKVHLAATISLVERNVLTWDVAYTAPFAGTLRDYQPDWNGSLFCRQSLSRTGLDSTGMLALCHGESAWGCDCSSSVDRSLGTARDWRPQRLVCRHNHLSDERTRCRPARRLYQEALGDKSLRRAGIVFVRQV